MTSETKICQNCKQSFAIEPEDFAFYEKIRVPPPTWCPECRLVRRLLFFNERTIYKRPCALCGKDFMSLFPKESPYTVYCDACWWSDKWDPLSYGKEVDFSRPFLEQLHELFRQVPQIGRNVITSTFVNSDYCNAASYLKNCYLIFNSDYDEDCMFSTYLERSKSSFDLYMCDHCERCYEGSNLLKDFNVRWSDNCNECIDVSFSKNCIGCSHCFGCVNLHRKQYHIWNQSYSKEEYFKETAKYDIGSFRAVEEFKKRSRELSLRYPKKFAEGFHNENVSGDYVYNSKNTFWSDEVGDCRDCKFCQFLFLFPTSDAYDYTMWGIAERIYECMGAGGGARDVKFCTNTWTEHMNVEYSRDVFLASSDLFGCIAPKKYRFCILNKQYSEGEYRALRGKVIAHMDAMPYVDRKGRVYKYGEFFPPELSPFGYNETIAQAHRPLTKDDTEKAGFLWHHLEATTYQPTVRAEELPDNIKEVADSILTEVIECAHKGNCIDQCPGAFRITPQELAFYRQSLIPLPRLCHNCRHYARLFYHNPILRLFKRKCQCGGSDSANGVYKNAATHFHGTASCPNGFETSYAPDRSEIVYCEQCYNAEVV